jgi:hypothetical protein
VIGGYPAKIAWFQAEKAIKVTRAIKEIREIEGKRATMATKEIMDYLALTAKIAWYPALKARMG